MEVSIEPITAESAANLELLYRKYFREMVPDHQSNASGGPTQHLRTLSKYWTSDSHWPYWICAGGEVAGFCLARTYPGDHGTHDIEQFYIQGKYKRQGVGTKALKQVLVLHPGNWLVRVLKTNEAGLSFWCRAVEACVGNEYVRRFELDEGLEMHFIRFMSRVVVSGWQA